MRALFLFLAFPFFAPTVTRKSKDQNLFLLIVYGLFLIMAEFIGAFSAIGDVPNAESLFPNFSQNFSLTGHCGFHWWHDHMAIWLVPLATNTISFLYESFRWYVFDAGVPATSSLGEPNTPRPRHRDEMPVVRKDPPGNFEEMWQRVQDCETISQEDARNLFGQVLKLLMEDKIKWPEAHSIAQSIHNGRVHTIEMENSGAPVVPAEPVDETAPREMNPGRRGVGGSGGCHYDD